MKAKETRDFAGPTLRYADVTDYMEEARPLILAKVRNMGAGGNSRVVVVLVVARR